MKLENELHTTENFDLIGKKRNLIYKFWDRKICRVVISDQKCSGLKREKSHNCFFINLETNIFTNKTIPKLVNESGNVIYGPTKVKHHLTCFNNIFSNNELISNRFAVFVTCTHILTYLWNKLLIDLYLCVYDRVCKVPRVLFNICVCERKLISFVWSFKFHFLLVWYGAAKINHTRKVASCWHA